MAGLLDAGSLGLGELPALDSDELGPLAEELLRDGFEDGFFRGPLQHMDEGPTALPFETTAAHHYGHFGHEPNHPAGPATSSHVQRTTTTGGSEAFEELEDELAEMEAAEGGGPIGKRRRRIRNSKQQELNRLAQQRYRMRKKEKFGELQVAVNSLSDKVQQLRVLEGEAQQLRSAKFNLTQQLHQRDQTLAQLNNALGCQAAALSATSKRAEQLEKQLDLSTGQLQEARQRNAQLSLEATQARALHEAAASAAGSSLAAGLPSGIDPQALADKLMSVVMVALSDVSAQQPAATSVLTSEAIAYAISRSLTSCCRELLLSSLPQKHMPGADTSVALAVSCM